MSAETKVALEAAIQAHVADECDGDHAGAYIVLTETTSLAEWASDVGSIFVASHGSRFTIRGLVEIWRDINQRTHAGDADDD